jgi:hypothetical protein
MAKEVTTRQVDSLTKTRIISKSPFRNWQIENKLLATFSKTRFTGNDAVGLTSWMTLRRTPFRVASAAAPSAAALLVGPVDPHCS